MYYKNSNDKTKKFLEENKMNKVFKSISVLLMLTFLFVACREEPKVPVETEQALSVNSCEGCHTNYAHLKKVYSPDTVSAGGVAVVRYLT